MNETIYCCNCKEDIQARLTDGSEIYPHSPMLAETPYWIHDKCGGYVGTHHKSDDPYKPLGCIPSEEVKQARQAIHSQMDPIWKSGNISRTDLYKRVSRAIGKEFHAGEVRSTEEADKIMKVLRDIEDSLQAPPMDKMEDIIKLAREADQGEHDLYEY